MKRLKEIGFQLMVGLYWLGIPAAFLVGAFWLTRILPDGLAWIPWLAIVPVGFGLLILTIIWVVKFATVIAVGESESA